MERTNRDLETVIKSQKEQLARYEKRLKDIVTAYKGLLKEKEALETSLLAFTSNEEKKNTSESDSNQSSPVTTNVIDKDDVNQSTADEGDNLKTQIQTLMNSLATLSAEKSRMEASFQADKKQLRAQLVQKDETIADLHTKIKETQERAKIDIEEIKAKWIIERQERDKETNNQILMVRELQKLYADERHLKENIEMQLNNFKTQFASNEAENSRLRNLQAQLKEAHNQLKQYQADAKLLDKEHDRDSAALLRQVQQEMQRLKEQHAVAIKTEQRRVQLAEEQSRKQVALHEDRVANLEARLAELSTTVGSYDRLRQQDQDAIAALRKQLQDLERISHAHDTTTSSVQLKDQENDAVKLLRKQSVVIELPAVVDEIIHLKNILLRENAHAANPIDLQKIFHISNDHSQCEYEQKRVSQQLESAHLQIEDLEEKTKQQRLHIATLQDKVQVLNGNIEEQEQEMKNYNSKLRAAVKEERAKWKETHAEMENEYRCKLNDLEEQLQKQRQRSLQLLEEKEQEIKTLQTSFEIFYNPTVGHVPPMNSEVNINNASSDGDSNDELHSMGALRRLTVKPKKLSSCHMLHYANEIARKDIEIANLRKAKYVAETSMRKAVQDKVTAQEELSNKIDDLEEHVDRLERCKTREGANLEYLKNVIISYIVSKDPDGRRHMMNAISAVLQFTTTEMQAINAALHK